MDNTNKNAINGVPTVVLVHFNCKFHGVSHWLLLHPLFDYAASVRLCILLLVALILPHSAVT
jgi:hypothetical protein